ncbi:hypothetical protein ACOMHN_024460 [Nucella lapillus]
MRNDEGRPSTPPRKEPGSTRIPVYHSLPRSGRWAAAVVYTRASSSAGSGGLNKLKPPNAQRPGGIPGSVSLIGAQQRKGSAGSGPVSLTTQRGSLDSGSGSNPGCLSQSHDLDDLHVAHKGVHRRVRTWMWPTRVSIAESGPGCGPQGCPSQSQDLDDLHVAHKGVHRRVMTWMTCMWPTRVSIAESGPGCGPQGCPSQSHDLDDLHVAHKGVYRRVMTWMTCMWPTKVSIAESGPGCGPQGCPSQSQDLDVAHKGVHRRVTTCMWPTRVSIAESGPGCGPQGCPSQS